MITKQLSVFVENKKGRLSAILNLLAENDVDLSALSLADTAEFGVLRLIVNKPELAKKILNDSGVIVKITDVLAVVLDDAPGGAAKVVDTLYKNDVSIEYMYAFDTKVTGKALMVAKTDNVKEANELLMQSGFSDVSTDDIFK